MKFSWKVALTLTATVLIGLGSGCSSSSPTNDSSTSPGSATQPSTSSTPESPSSVTSQVTKIHEPAESPNNSEAQTPATVLRAFLIALAEGDSAKGGGLIVANPDAEILWQGKAFPPEVFAELSRSLETGLQPLKIGDRVELPGGKSIVVDESHVNDNRAEFTMPGNPVPFIVVKSDGQWRVDASTVIAARKAARLASSPQSEWTLSDELLNELDAEVDAGFGFRVRAPKGFQLIQKGNPSVWRGAARPDGSAATITLVLAEAGDDENPKSYLSVNSFEDFCRKMQSKVRAKLNWSNAATERGTIGGVPFNRSSMSGAAANGSAVIESLCYQGVWQRTIIMFSTMDTAAHFAESSPLLEAVILSLRK